MSNKKRVNMNLQWITIVFFTTFILSMTFSYVSTVVMENIHLGIAIFMLIVIILIGVLFDMIAVAIAAVDIEALRAKASMKQKGAKTAIKLAMNADRVSSVCADIVGDVFGILTGSVGVLIALQIANTYDFSLALVSLVVGGVIASLTVTGKALEKQIALKNANEIIYFVGKILEFYKK